MLSDRARYLEEVRARVDGGDEIESCSVQITSIEDIQPTSVGVLTICAIICIDCAIVAAVAPVPPAAAVVVVFTIANTALTIEVRVSLRAATALALV